MNSFKHKSNYLLFFTIFLTSFLIGIIFSFSIANKNLFVVGKTEKESILNTFIQTDDTLDLDRFWEVYNIINNKSYGISEVEKEELIDGAIKGLVSGLGDKHSEYLNSEERIEFEGELSGDFEGIGALVEKHTLGVQLDRIIKGSPALDAGLKAKDIIITADGIELHNISLYEGISHIKGPAGTDVVLEVLREGESELLDITVTRRKINIPSIDSELLDNNIGYIAINMFGDDTVENFKSALLELNNTEGLIIDLRDNGGGYLYAATEILSELLEYDTLLVTTKYYDSRKNEKYKSINYTDPYNKPIVVLINENSASASEIVSGALHDYEKGILVGKKTYGKGSVQQPFSVSNNGLLKITIAKWFTPKGKNIDKEGINPDIEVSFKEDDYINNYDRQLEVAKEVLQEFINLGSFTQTVEKFTTKEQNNKKEEN